MKPLVCTSYNVRTAVSGRPVLGVKPLLRRQRKNRTTSTPPGSGTMPSSGAPINLAEQGGGVLYHGVLYHGVENELEDSGPSLSFGGASLQRMGEQQSLPPGVPEVHPPRHSGLRAAVGDATRHRAGVPGGAGLLVGAGLFRSGVHEDPAVRKARERLLPGVQAQPERRSRWSCAALHRVAAGISELLPQAQRAGTAGP